MKKRILFVHETFGRLAGAEQNIQVTASHLKETFDLSFLYRERSGRAENVFEDLFPQSYAVPFDGPAAETQKRTRNVLQAVRPDLIYVHKCIANPVLETLVEWGGPLVRMEHDHDIYCMRSYKYFPWNRQICTRKAGLCCLFPCLAFLKRDRKRGRFGMRWVSYRQKMRCIELNREFSAMFAVTNYMRDELIRQGFLPERIHLFPPIPEPTDNAFQSTFAETNRVLFAGQIIRGKGLDILLRALALCRQPFRLTVLGSGSHQPFCETLARQLGLADRVEFPGFVPFEKMAGFYREATLVTVPSVWPEPIATIGLEALRYGLPVVGFDAGGIRDWLRDGENGFLIPWMDLETMAEKIDFLLSRKEEARRLGEQGRALVNREYKFDQYIQRLTAIFEKLMTAK